MAKQSAIRVPPTPSHVKISRQTLSTDNIPNGTDSTNAGGGGVVSGPTQMGQNATDPVRGQAGQRETNPLGTLPSQPTGNQPAPVGNRTANLTKKGFSKQAIERIQDIHTQSRSRPVIGVNQRLPAAHKEGIGPR